MARGATREGTAEPGDAVASRGRMLLLRVAALLFGLTWLLVPGFAAPDLWAAASGDPEWVPVATLEAGWGVLGAALAATFVHLAARPRSADADVLVLSAAWVGLLLGCLLAGEGPMALYVAVLAAQVVVVALLSGARPWRLGRQVQPVLVALTVGGGLLALPHVLRLAAADRDGTLPSDVTMGVDHWALQAGSFLALLLVALTAALVQAARTWGALLVVLSTGYVALTSLRFPDSAASWALPWPWVSIAWAVAFLAVAVAARRPRTR